MVYQSAPIAPLSPRARMDGSARRVRTASPWREASLMTSAKREPDRPVDITGMTAQPRRTDPDFELLIQHASRTLDPSTAVRFRDQKLHSTVYGAAQLLVRPTSGFGVWSGTSFAAP